MGLPKGGMMNQLRVALEGQGFVSTDMKRRAAAKARRERDRAIARALKTRDEAGRFRSVKADRMSAAAYARLERALREG